MSYGVPPPMNPYDPAGSGPYHRPQGTNKMAITSAALGALGLLCCGALAGIPALVLGFVARGQIARSGEQGSGFALTGIILGGLATLWGIVYAYLVLSGTVESPFNRL